MEDRRASLSKSSIRVAYRLASPGGPRWGNRSRTGGGPGKRPRRSAAPPKGRRNAPREHSGGCPLHGRKHGKDHAGGHGKVHRGRHGEGRARPLFDKGWTETLSAEQKAALDKLHVDYAKNKVQQRLKIEALKVQLTVLATADESQPEAAATKIDALLATKREMLLAKQAYIAEQRAVLTPEQRVSFDMTMIHQALPSGKCPQGRRH
jgi:Spy/CpxP family protein refolding chaperone